MKGILFVSVLAAMVIALVSAASASIVYYGSGGGYAYPSSVNTVSVTYNSPGAYVYAGYYNGPRYAYYGTVHPYAYTPYNAYYNNYAYVNNYAYAPSAYATPYYPTYTYGNYNYGYNNCYTHCYWSGGYQYCSC